MASIPNLEAANNRRRRDLPRVHHPGKRLVSVRGLRPEETNRYETAGYTVLLPASAIPGWPADIVLPSDPAWKGEPAAIVAAVRTLILRLMVLGLIWLMVPGLAEAAENLWHLAQAGHTAHARDAGADHAPEGDEHGCSGTFHLCSCHHSPATALAPAGSTRDLAPVDRSCPRNEKTSRGPDLPGLFRPPRV